MVKETPIKIYYKQNEKWLKPYFENYHSFACWTKHTIKNHDLKISVEIKQLQQIIKQTRKQNY
jgi:hypothetical protein